MERPAVFMISITVLYCLTLAFLSHLSILESNEENLFNKKFNNLTSKVYYFQIPRSSKSTAFKYLQMDSVDLSKLIQEPLSSSMELLEFSVFSVDSVYFNCKTITFSISPYKYYWFNLTAL